MNCADYERWLDAGRPEAVHAAAEAHADACVSCAENLAAAEALDALLAGPAAAAPASLTEDVMRQVAAEPRRGADLASALAEPVLPWWIQSLAQPEMVLAAILAAITIGAAPHLLSIVPSLLARGNALVATTTLPVPQLGLDLSLIGSLPPVAVIPAVGFLMCAGTCLVAWSLYRWGTARI